MKKISAIVPVFNTGSSAIKLILNLFKNTRNLEIIVIDDGSTDDSYDLLKEFIRQYRIKYNGPNYPTIKLLHQDNNGPSAARNAGLKVATGDYIVFPDSDDSVENDFLNTMLEGLTKYDNTESNNLKIALASCAINYYRKGKITRVLYNNDVKSRLPEESFIAYILRLIYTDGRLYAVNNKIFRHDVIRKFNLLFDESINFAEDTKFVLNYLKAAAKSGYTNLEFIEEPLYNYNFGTSTSIASNSSLSWNNWQKSFSYLMNWAGKNPSKKEQKALRLVYVRWKISHALAVARSNQSFGHKMQHTNIFFLLPAQVIIKFRK